MIRRESTASWTGIYPVEEYFQLDLGSTKGSRQVGVCEAIKLLLAGRSWQTAEYRPRHGLHGVACGGRTAV